ncbi:hypothetical protein Esti_005428 [Eimeria stiedai]
MRRVPRNDGICCLPPCEHTWSSLPLGFCCLSDSGFSEVYRHLNSVMEAAVPLLPPTVAPAASPPRNDEQQQQQQQKGEQVPRPLLPLSLLVLAEGLDGSLCPLVNDLAQQLAQQLLVLHEEHPFLLSVGEAASRSGGGAPLGPSPPFSLEVEGRLGVIREKDSGARLQLPLATHAVLQPSFCMQVGGPLGGSLEDDESPGGRFVAGLSGAQFTDLKSFLLSTISKNERVAEQRLQAHLALMGFEPSGAPLGALDELTEEDAQGEGPSGPFSGSGLQWHLDGNDWRVLPERETEENYYHIPALQAAARFSSSKKISSSFAGGPSGPRSGGPLHMGGPGGAGGPPVSVQSLGQLLVSPGIYKKSLLQWNVYSGADKDEAFRPTDEFGSAASAADEAAERTRVDFRLAINFEHKIELKELQRSLMQGGASTQAGAPGLLARGGGGALRGYPGAGGPPAPPSSDPQFRRLRQRQSLVHRSGLRIDLTKVQQQMRPSWSRPTGPRREGQSGKWLYEVELELSPVQIAKAILHKRKTGDPRPLWCLCVTFLSLLRELAAPLNSPLGAHAHSGLGGGGGPQNGRNGRKGPSSSEAELADLEDVQSSATEKAIFKHFLADQLPLIGDYAYRAVALRFQEKVEKGEEMVQSLEEFLKEPDVDKKCLYTHNKTELPGPWIPHRDADGRVHLVEVKRPTT